MSWPSGPLTWACPVMDGDVTSHPWEPQPEQLPHSLWPLCFAWSAMWSLKICCGSPQRHSIQTRGREADEKQGEGSQQEENIGFPHQGIRCMFPLCSGFSVLVPASFMWKITMSHICSTSQQPCLLETSLQSLTYWVIKFKSKSVLQLPVRSLCWTGLPTRQNIILWASLFLNW